MVPISRCKKFLKREEFKKKEISKRGVQFTLPSKRKRKIIAVCGKGGAGKTAITAMMAGTLRKMSDKSRMLLIDADPAGGLAFAMGVEVKKTVGEVREEIIAKARKKDPQIKEQLANAIDYYILETLVEREGFGLLAMGRGESVGCFCPVNSLLREAVEALADSYDRIIIDGEAGIEQIMRQVMREVDTLIVVSDLSARGLNTASLIKELVEGKGVLSHPKLLLVINRCSDKSAADNASQKLGMKLAGVVPEDPTVSARDMGSAPLCDMPMDAPAMKAVAEIVEILFPKL